MLCRKVAVVAADLTDQCVRGASTINPYKVYVHSTVNQSSMNYKNIGGTQHVMNINEKLQ